MSRKSTDEESQAKAKSHLHYIEVLKDVRAILIERKEQDAHTASPTRTPTPTCRKRKEFSPTRQSTDSNKAIKTESTAPCPDDKLTNGAWRQLIASGCEKPSTGKKTLVIKPASYAAAVLVAPVG